MIDNNLISRQQSLITGRTLNYRFSEGQSTLSSQDVEEVGGRGAVRDNPVRVL